MLTLQEILTGIRQLNEEEKNIVKWCATRQVDSKNI